MSSVLLGGPAASAPDAGAPAAPRGPSAPDERERGNAVTIIAGVGVLLLAMGVGVLIGRSGGGGTQTVAAAPQVLSVPAGGIAATGAGASEPVAFSDDWPANTNGYTVQLQKLALTGTQTSAVVAAKGDASAKGAKGVGALKSDDYSSLKAGSYIVYSGVYAKKAQAENALKGLKKSFPGAEVITVSTGAAAAGSAAGKSPQAGVSAKAPPSQKAVEKIAKQPNGKNYEQESKKLPNQVLTP